MNTGIIVPLSAYVHIPFCRRRCYYCDFPISVLGDRNRGEDSGTIRQYIDWLCQEITTTGGEGNPLQTVFFGGGTPSLLDPAQVGRILDVLSQRCGIAADAEISMEIDPGTFDLTQLIGYRQAGVNRISLGVQAFQEELLKACGRSHNLADIFSSVEKICKAGFDEFSLDLISGLPHQTYQMWQESLEKAVGFAPTHISVYDLIVEPVTAFGRQYQPGSKPLPSDEMAVQMYTLAQQILTDAGYQHYEISNYAQPGHQCRHNRVYWENRPYYGFGMGAASYVNGKRFTRPRTREDYYQWVESGCKVDVAQLGLEDVLLETLMLGLRLAEGLDLARLYRDFGAQTVQKIWDCLQPYYQQGWVAIDGDGVDMLGLSQELGNHRTAKERRTRRSEGRGDVLVNCCVSQAEVMPNLGRLRLTDPDGFLFSNTVLATLFESFDDQ